MRAASKPPRAVTPCLAPMPPCPPGGQELLFLSRQALFAPPKAIRCCSATPKAQHSAWPHAHPFAHTPTYSHALTASIPSRAPCYFHILRAANAAMLQTLSLPLPLLLLLLCCLLLP